MSKLPRLGIVVIPEPHGLGQLVDRRLVAGQKVPAFGSAGTTVKPDVERFFGRRERGLLARVKAHRHHVELIAYVKLELLQAFEQSVKHHGAEHRALIVDQGEDRRLVAEIVCEPHRLSGFVSELEIERDLLVESLVDAHVAE